MEEKLEMFVEGKLTEEEFERDSEVEVKGCHWEMKQWGQRWLRRLVGQKHQQ